MSQKEFWGRMAKWAFILGYGICSGLAASNGFVIALCLFAVAFLIFAPKFVGAIGAALLSLGGGIGFALNHQDWQVGAVLFVIVLVISLILEKGGSVLFHSPSNQPRNMSGS